jgi:uncharacterized protein (DUF1697 family)
MVMPKYAAFLRAINVGGHTVKMETLRHLFETLGFAGVETFIASGNVIFEAESENPQALERKIEAHLFESLGYKVETFLRLIGELEKIIRHPSFPDDQLNAEGSTLYVGFTAGLPEEAVVQKLLSCKTELDDFYVHEREIYWLCRTRMSDSVFSGARLEKILGQPATLRNVSTLKKIVEKYA